MLAAFALSVGAPGAVSKASADAQCKAGQSTPDGKGGDWKGGLHDGASGNTPLTVPGATRVTVEEMKCLLGAYGEGRMVGLTPINEDKGIPGTWQMVDSWSGTSFDGDSQLMTERQLHYTVGTDLDRPFVVYCHNSGCFMSYNVVLRAAKLGYRNIYWLRGGIDEWRGKGGEVGAIYPAIRAIGNEAHTRITCMVWADALNILKLAPEKSYKAFGEADFAALKKLLPQPTLGEAAVHIREDFIDDNEDGLESLADFVGRSPGLVPQYRKTRFGVYDLACRKIPGAPADLFPG